MAAHVTPELARELRSRLQDATIKCSERCLYQSAKWAAELLTSIASFEDLNSASDTNFDSSMKNFEAKTPPPPLVALPNEDPHEVLIEAREAHRYLLAKSYFDTREYNRCAAVFISPSIPTGGLSSGPKYEPRIPSTAPVVREKKKSYGKKVPQNPYPELSQKSLFLALYAKYMAGEKRKDEESEMVLGPADGGTTVNRELADLARGLEGWFAERKEKGLEQQGQGWLEYLYGVVLAKGKNEEEAKKWLIRAVHLCPFHWGAWHELNDLLGNTEDLHRVSDELPENIMTLIFHLYCSQELYQATSETHTSLAQLLEIFPTSAFLKTQQALLHYHSKDFEEASSLFTSLLLSDPYRLDALDHYSNILYVMANRPHLSFLAQLATATDKFRPETCCVVGNYYSLKSEHEKAVMYFRRALTLDRNFLSAWTLMGHEYIEMKNTHAAIESYRRAVDVNRKDYRAWYGLGQAYEVLDMSFYALFYYQRAAALRPYDPKMWQAVGSCYAKMDRPDQSIKALKRALVAGTYYETTGSNMNSFASTTQSQPQQTGRKLLDPETLHQIATMYEKLEDLEEATAYMELTVQQETGNPPLRGEGSDTDEGMDDADGGEGFGTGVTATTSKARLWLARWAMRNGDLERADALCGELCQDGVEVEEAKALMRDVRARREAAGGGSG